MFYLSDILSLSSKFRLCHFSELVLDQMAGVSKSMKRQWEQEELIDQWTLL
jgi:hypothetical protein